MGLCYEGGGDPLSINRVFLSFQSPPSSFPPSPPLPPCETHKPSSKGDGEGERESERERERGSREDNPLLPLLQAFIYFYKAMERRGEGERGWRGGGRREVKISSGGPRYSVAAAPLRV